MGEICGIHHEISSNKIEREFNEKFRLCSREREAGGGGRPMAAWGIKASADISHVKRSLPPFLFIK